MNELMLYDQQGAVRAAEHISRPFEDGDEVFAVDEANAIVIDGMFPGYDLKTRALNEHSRHNSTYIDIMAHTLGVAELTRKRILHILLVDNITAETANRIEEKAENRETEN